LADTRNHNADEESALAGVEKIIDETDTVVDGTITPTAAAAAGPQTAAAAGSAEHLNAISTQHHKLPTVSLKKLSM
jgi:hypothetical protein